MRKSLGCSILSKLRQYRQIAKQLNQALFYKGINTTKNSCKNTAMKQTKFTECASQPFRIDGRNCENTILLCSELAELMPGVETSLQHTQEMKQCSKRSVSHQSIPSLLSNFPLQDLGLSRPLSSLHEILQNGSSRNPFFFQCKPGYKSMQKTVLYKYTKCYKNE